MELIEVEKNEWVFRDPALTDEIESKFNAALDAYDDGHHEEAETMVRAVVSTCSRALALALAKRVPEARAVLQTCISRLPLVAKELLSREHPEPDRTHPGAITLGGADQAWEYWNGYGQYWRRSRSAMRLLREAAEGTQTNS